MRRDFPQRRAIRRPLQRPRHAATRGLMSGHAPRVRGGRAGRWRSSQRRRAAFLYLRVLPLSAPPTEKAAARKQQSGEASTSDGPWYSEDWCERHWDYEIVNPKWTIS
jgi:hypothetical protein